MKTCRRCAKEKPLSEFYKHPKKRDLLQSHCKDCMKAASEEWRKSVTSQDRAMAGLYTPNYRRPRGVKAGTDADFEAFKRHLLKRQWPVWTGYDELDLMIDAELKYDPGLAPVVARLRGEAA